MFRIFVINFYQEMDNDKPSNPPNIEMEKINTELKNQSINIENDTVKETVSASDNKSEAETFREKGNEEFRSKFFLRKFLTIFYKKKIFI